MSNEPKAAPTPLVYAIAELPGVMGVSIGTVRSLIKSGALPARKLARRTIVMRADVLTYLSSLPLITAAPPPARPDGRTVPSPLDQIVDVHMRREIEALSMRRLPIANAN